MTTPRHLVRTAIATALLALALLIPASASAASAADSMSAEFLAILDDDFSTAKTRDESLDRFGKKLHATGYLSGITEMVGLQGGYVLNGEFQPVCFPDGGISTDIAVSAVKLTAARAKVVPSPRILILVAFSNAFPCAPEPTGTVRR